jgi:cysteine desulfurase family protein (TIGR01976 family)
MPAFDVAAIRAQFPALRRQQDGRPVVFLDGPGGTQVPDRVIDAVTGYYRTMNANSGGSFVTSRATDALAEAAHAAVATFLGAAVRDEVKFGYNMTTLTFHVSRAIAATFAAGDEVVVTTLDHEANVSPWRAIAADRGLVVRTVDIHPEDGTLDLESLDAVLGDRTRLVAFGYASNALGTINPVAEIVRRAHAVGALTYVDAVHYAPHGSIDVRALDTDFLVCSAYKWFGPHLGVLYGKAAVLDRLPAYKVRPAHDRYETGTPSFEAYAGTLAAVEYLRDLGRTYGDTADGAGSGEARGELVAAMRAITGHDRSLAGRMLDGLRAIQGVHVWGIAEPARIAERTPTFAVTLDRISPADAAAELGRAGIFTWDGDFYARGLIERLGTHERGGVLRLGLVHYSTEAEVDRTLEALSRLAAGAPVGSPAPVGSGPLSR